MGVVITVRTIKGVDGQPRMLGLLKLRIQPCWSNCTNIIFLIFFKYFVNLVALMID